MNSGGLGVEEAANEVLVSVAVAREDAIKQSAGTLVRSRARFAVRSDAAAAHEMVGRPLEATVGPSKLDSGQPHDLIDRHGGQRVGVLRVGLPVDLPNRLVDVLPDAERSREPPPEHAFEPLSVAVDQLEAQLLRPSLHAHDESLRARL